MPSLLRGVGGAGGGGGAPFSPSDLSGLFVWLKADAANCYADAARTTLIAGSSGNPVGGWADLSGAGTPFHMGQTQVSAPDRRPTWQGNVVNGHPALRFDGVDDFLLGPLLTYPSAVEMWVVWKKVTAGDHGSYGHFSWNAGDSHITWSDNMAYESFATSSRKDSITGITSLLTSWNVYEVHSLANDYAITVNGVSKFTTATNTVSWDDGPILGSGDNGRPPVDYFSAMDIAEVVMFNTARTAGERTQVRGYLGTEYGISV